MASGGTWLTGEHGERVWQPTQKTITSTGEHGDQHVASNPEYLKQQEQATMKPWQAPTLVGGKFQNQADVDAFKAALAPKSYGWNSGGEHATGAGAIHSDIGNANFAAANKWGQDQGIIEKPAGQGGGFFGGALKFIGDSALKIALMPPVTAALTAGTATALGAGGAAGGAGAGGGAGGAGGAAAAEGAGMTTAEMIAAHGLQAGSAFVPGGGAAAAGTVGAAGAGAGAGASLLGGPDTIAPGGVALDPLAAPAAEGAPSALGPYNGANTVGTQGFEGGTGVGGAPSSAPSLTSSGDTLGKVGTFARDAIAIGGLLGGLAGLQGGKSPASPEQPPPVPQATSSQIGTQADVKADMQKGAAPGGPNAGIDTTWLTGMGGVPEDQLRLGRSTLLGQ